METGSLDGVADNVGVERVENDAVRAERMQPLGLLRRPRGANRLVARLDQLRHEPAADHAGRSDYEYTHAFHAPLGFVDCVLASLTPQRALV